jgi:hypothetical protein
MFNFRHLTFAALLVGMVPMTGCYVDAQEPAVAEGYEPQYYNGYVVYYDGVGRPFYYYNGAQMWVPESSPYYYGYVNHWRAYGPAYNRWYAGYGYRYRGYYRPGGYYRAGVGVRYRR